MANCIKKTLLFSSFIIFAFLTFGSPRSPRVQSQTPGNTALSKWRPTRDLPGVRYVGSSVCVECHATKAAQLSTPMAHALEVAADSDILRARPQLTFRDGPYTHQITRQGERIIYTVTDGVRTISEPILYGFGQGVFGQTYVFLHNGLYYESRASYFQELQSLDITILHPRSAPLSLEDALGRPMTAEAARGCFSCHSTPALGGTRLELNHITPGVTCEACHGPGERHVAAMKAKNYEDSQIFNPKTLDAFDLTQEFCGACHQSFDTVMLLPGRGGINNIRFQPYRVFSSRAHFINDPRMSCVACHNPHDKMKREVAFYDAKCLACHLSSPTETKTAARMGAACPVGKQQCVTCHMPKVELPEMHAKFTDHWIRIVKPNEPVPR